MRRIKKYGTLVCLAVLFFFFSMFTVYAADKPVVVESFTGENEVVIYLDGIQGELADVTVQAGTMACESLAQSRLSETGQPVKTLIMLDNSKSVQKASRKHITKLLKEIIAGRMDNEQVAIAVFNKGLKYLADYTSDEAVLSKALDEITYQKTNTYLTDVLYELLAEKYVQNEENLFYRIIVISDGVDNKEFGYTKDELEDLLKEHPVPIYTVGLENAKKSNQEQLKNMFALSRLTGADNFLLNHTQVLPKVIKSLSEDRDIIRLAAGVPDELRDGSRKTVKITYASGKSVSKEIVMPQQLKAAEDKDADREADRTEDAKNGESALSDVEMEENGETGIMGMPVIILILAVVLVLAAVIVVIVKKRPILNSKREQNYYSRQGSITGQKQGKVMSQKQSCIADRIQESIADPYQSNITAQEQNIMDSQKTEQMSDDTETEDSDTEIDQEENAQTSSYITLTDMNVPSISFRVSISDSVTIGRMGECGIVIDYDKSVSSRHCQIAVQNGRFYITDLNSSNGTFIDGKKVQSKVEVVSGNLLKIGRLTFRFECKS